MKAYKDANKTNAILLWIGFASFILATLACIVVWVAVVKSAAGFADWYSEYMPYYGDDSDDYDYYDSDDDDDEEETEEPETEEPETEKSEPDATEFDVTKYEYKEVTDWDTMKINGATITVPATVKDVENLGLIIDESIYS
mgnify:CR=1 FL=1